MSFVGIYKHGGSERIERGDNAECWFREIARYRGWNILKATSSQDRYDHWDFEITAEGFNSTLGIPELVKCKIDVKAMKKISNKDPVPQDIWTWVELHGRAEKSLGWMYGGKADYIAFETRNAFVIVDREYLIEFISQYVDRSIVVHHADRGQYCVYNRRNSHDEITLVELSKLEKIATDIWQKLPYMTPMPNTENCQHKTSDFNNWHLQRINTFKNMKSARVRRHEIAKLIDTVSVYNCCPFCRMKIYSDVKQSLLDKYM